MFRSLRAIFPPGRHQENEPVTMKPPVAITSMMDADEAEQLPEVQLSVTPEDVFSTTVGPPAKKTLAGWHVTSPEEVVDAVVHLLEGQ